MTLIDLMVRTLWRRERATPAADWLPAGVSFREGPRLCRLLRCNAVTLAPKTIIVAAGPLTLRTARHEMVHVAQWACFGWTFSVRYLWALLKEGRINRYESPAYAEGWRHPRTPWA